MSNYTLSKISINSGSIEFLKWVGLLSMTVDHLNTFLLNSAYPIMMQIGRIALPLFTIVIAYNVASYKGNIDKLILRVIKRLLLFGVAAIPAFAYHKFMIAPDRESLFILQWYDQVAFFFPLNVLFNFALLLLLIKWANKAKENTAYIIYLMIGLFILTPIGEYGLSSFLIGLGVYYLYSENLLARYLGQTLFVLGFCFLVVVYSQSFYAMLALPLFWIASNYNFKAPRAGYFFYAYYPLHISLIVLLATVTGSY